MNLTNIFNLFMVWFLRSPLHRIASKNTWWRNLRADSKISVHLQGKDLETYGKVIEDNEKVKEQLMRYLQKVPQYARYFKVNLDLDGHPHPEDVAHAAKERVMILLRSG